MNHRSEIFKVLCQPHSIDKYNPELKQDILWPCLRFPIALQAKGYQDLNLFESTMLRLIGEGENDIRQLSKKMGLINEKEEYSSLVHFLSAKLQQLNLITERFRLTEEGKQLLNKMNNAESRPIADTVAATVYFDLLNQCWLPMISRDEIKPIHVDTPESDLVQFTQGSPGKPKQIEAFLPLLPDQEQKKRQEYARKNLNERTVIDIIRRSRQQDKMLGGHNGNRDGFITEKGTISINSPEEGELVYLHCYVFKVSGYEQFYVSDGFRSTIQDRFSQGFNNKCNEYKNLREKLCRKSRKVHNRQVRLTTPDLDSLYQELTTKKVSNSRHYAEYEDNLRSFISRSYSEIEHFLAKCYSFPKLKKCIPELSSDSQRNAKLALKIASDLGFDVKNSIVNNLLKVKKGAVINLKADQSVVMAPLLFCHLYAARDESQQPMAKLAKEYPKLLIDIANLKCLRNPIDHGDGAKIRNQIGSKQVESSYQLVKRMREILSGWLSIDDNRKRGQTMPDWHKDDIRRKAKDELDKFFGLMLDRMNEAISEGLFRFLVCANFEDARERVNALAGALQHALYQSSQMLDKNEAKDIEDVKKQLEKEAKNIPKSSPDKIDNALNGLNATLGANFIAFWAQITDEQQNYIIEKKFIKAVDDLIKIRGHSGAILGQNDNLNQIKPKVFELIKHLVEQYCE